MLDDDRFVYLLCIFSSSLWPSAIDPSLSQGLILESGLAGSKVVKEIVLTSEKEALQDWFPTLENVLVEQCRANQSRWISSSPSIEVHHKSCADWGKERTSHDTALVCAISWRLSCTLDCFIENASQDTFRFSPLHHLSTVWRNITQVTGFLLLAA